MSEEDYKKLTKDQRRARKLALMQAAGDVCKAPTEPMRSPEEYHTWNFRTKFRVIETNLVCVLVT